MENDIFKANSPGLVPVSKFNEFIKYPSVAAIRQYIFYNTNGFKNKVIRYMGKRQYIKLSEFQKWIEENNQQRAV